MPAMNSNESFVAQTPFQKDPFGFIKAEQFESLGIDPSDIPAGTFPARRHPSWLVSRFGGNAYGFGFVEAYGRLGPRDLKLVQSMAVGDSGDIRRRYKEINKIYKKAGLLIRLSSKGEPYYLIPSHLAVTSISAIAHKTEEIRRVIELHRKKCLKEAHTIGVLTHAGDPLVGELSLNLKEHEFILLDSVQKLRKLEKQLDLVVLTRDIYEIILTDQFFPAPDRRISKKELDSFSIYVLKKIYYLLESGGEFFALANLLPLRTDQWVEVTFRNLYEEKSFILFSHIFRTRKKYRGKGKSLKINAFDLQKYLNPPYVEKDIIDRLFGGRSLEDMSLEEINNLPYLNFSMKNELSHDQEKTWSRLFSLFFDKAFLKPICPISLRREWERRFTTDGYTPEFMLAYLGERKPLTTSLEDLEKDVESSKLSGCPLTLLAEYRDSFDYVLSTLRVVQRIKNGKYSGFPETLIDRLTESIRNRKRRYPGLNDVFRLLSKINQIEKISDYLNPLGIEGKRTRVLQNLETLSLLGFSYGELKELFLIVVGHTPMGRILSGKISEGAMKPVSDLARGYELQHALKLLRYCRLMSLAETVASKKADLTLAELIELFDLYDSTVRVVTNREIDWDQLLDEKIAAAGGMRNKAVQKILRMMNYFEFLANWFELEHKGQMEKEVLADYNDEKLWKIENVIRLVRTISDFEEKYLMDDPLQASIFYRKFLNMEFHGTGRLFEKMSSEQVFLLLWIAVNVSRGDIINFNPLVAGMDNMKLEDHVGKLEEEAGAINVNYLSPSALSRFSGQLYEQGTSFVVGTGFMLSVNPETGAVDVHYVDMDTNLKSLEKLCSGYTGANILSQIPVQEFEQMEILFSNLEGFYRSHLKLVSEADPGLKLPSRQIKWFESAKRLREYVRAKFVECVFRPEQLYSQLDSLYHHSPLLLSFILPEFMGLRESRLPEKSYLRSSIMEHVLKSMQKIQALIGQDKKNFQDIHLLHKLAQKEFGPMAAGTVGLNEFQIDTLENLVQSLKKNPPLFDAFVKSFVFRDLGLVPALREKYKKEINPVDHAQAGALVLEKEKIALRYVSEKKANDYLILLVKYHNLIHQIIRGGYSYYAMQEVIDLGDKDLFDAIFVSSLIMFSAMGEDLILEDLAARLFQLRRLCQEIIAGEQTAEGYLQDIFASKGHAFYAVEGYKSQKKSGDSHPQASLDSYKWEESEKERYIKAGRMIYAMERIFRLRGVRYAEYVDLANMMLKVPLKYIYRKRNFTGIGYATFEKELFEALRIYNGLQLLPEMARHFVLEQLIEDRIRVFGFEEVSKFLNYPNLVKLLLLAVMSSKKLKENSRPVYLDFTGMAEQIEKRYEAVNDSLNSLSIQQIWEDASWLNYLFKSKTGIVLTRNDPKRVVAIDFVDRINIARKISRMSSINSVDALKNYFHSTLKSLRATPFFTEDYELELEKAFNQRLKQIIDLMLNETKRQMGAEKDFARVHRLYEDLLEQSLEIGFTDEQRHRLTDLYELRKDHLKREKLEEITTTLEMLSDIHELSDYWESTKWCLFTNRPFLGQEFEKLVARKFDETRERLGGP